MPANKKRLLILSAIFIALLLLTGFVGFKYFNNDQLNLSQISSRFKAATDSQPKLQPSPSASPKPIGTGQQTFKFSHGSKVTGPKPQTVTLDPIDPQPGQTQTITVVIDTDSPLTKTEVVIETDNDITIQPLKPISSNTYQAKLKLKDTYDYNYYIKFDLQSSTGNYHSGLRLRQP